MIPEVLSHIKEPRKQVFNPKRPKYCHCNVCPRRTIVTRHLPFIDTKSLESVLSDSGPVLVLFLPEYMTLM